MNLNIVLSSFPGLNAEGKSFIVSLLSTHDINSEIVWNYKNLSQQYGVSDHVIRKALNYLTCNEYLIECPHPARVGKPTKRYRVTDKYKSDFLNKNSHPYCMHTDLIQDLLSCKNKYKGLRGSHRLLLIILLAVADEFGVSSKFGSAELCKLMGIKSGALKTQIDELKKQRFINAHVEGGSSQYLFGVTAASYFINLDHKEFSLIKPRTAIFICLLKKANGETVDKEQASTAMTHVTLSNSIHYFANWVVGRNNENNKRKEKNQQRWEKLNYQATSPVPISDYEEFQNIAYFFVRKWTASELNTLQCKLNKCASYFLSNYFDDLSHGKKLITDELIGELKPSLLPIGLLQAIESGKEYKNVVHTQKQVEQLCRYILRFAILIAQKIKSVLSKNTAVEFNKYNFSVRPTFYKNSIYFVIDSNINADEDAYHIYEYTPQNKEFSFIEKRSTLLDEGKTICGLLYN